MRKFAILASIGLVLVATVLALLMLGKIGGDSSSLSGIQIGGTVAPGNSTMGTSDGGTTQNTTSQSLSKPSTAATTTQPQSTTQGCTVHAYGEWSVIEPAKCDAVGQKVRQCSVCGEEEKMTIAALGHTETVLPEKAATCTASGLSQGKACSVCGVILVAQETISPKGHTETVVPGRAPSCEQSGLTEGRKCTVCGVATVEQQSISQLAHAFSDWTVSREPSCAMDGFRERTCTACGYRDGENIPAHGEHNYQSGSCTGCGASVPATEGLKFELSSDGQSYICTGFSSYYNNTRNLVIPAYHNGKPVTGIGRMAFVNDNLDTVSLPEGIRTIADCAFSGSTMRSVTIPNSVVSLHGSAFWSCPNLETLYIYSTGWKKNTGYKIVDMDFSNPYQNANLFRDPPFRMAYTR